MLVPPVATKHETWIRYKRRLRKDRAAKAWIDKLVCQSHATEEFEEFFECIEEDIEIEGEVGSRPGKPVLVTPSLSHDVHQPTDVWGLARRGATICGSSMHVAGCGGL